ncbi:MAG: alanine racemase [Candidatus Riflebacteria bacterium]|nr:alanine racemase [Candidatus Riflebacteria bacterium]
MLYQTHAKVHLDNIKYNIDGIRKSVGNSRKILLAVKANGYGHGSVQISRMAEKIGVEWLGVATVPEGIELRNAGISLPILKFSPAFQEEMAEAVKNKITLSVCEIENINFLESECKKLNMQCNVHLKIDTGMGRIGCTPDEAPYLCTHITEKCPSLKLEGIFTHLPVSDEAEVDFTAGQIKKLKNTVDNIQRAIHREVSLVHCSNSGGILGHEAGWLNMVRPGIMLYGFYPSPDTPKTIPLKPGLSFLTRVSFLKKVAKGTSIGYGRSWVAKEDSWIATFPAGYADGFNRLFSNMGRVLIKGKSYPVVGRVCMDQSMAYLGSETDIKVGDQVTLIGKDGKEEITAYEWAEKLKTITYEVTCQINSRVQRIYS